MTSATSRRSDSESSQNSMTIRDASGDAALWVGGVGREVEGEFSDSRASSDWECGPSTMYWAST
jgi:hypothetical protein